MEGGLKIPRASHRGFTLIELTIVLVVIGFIVGGVLVGRELVKAAEIRSQISQITKYSSAMHTFETKYGGLPGDLQGGLAAQFGFYTATGCNATDTSKARNGNGLIDNNDGNLVWMDLSQANMIDQSFSAAPWTALGSTPCGTVILTTPQIEALFNQIYPSAKFARNIIQLTDEDSISNWFVIETPMLIVEDFNSSTFAISASVASAIDSKIDDGMPTTGNVRAQVCINGCHFGWSADDDIYSATTDNGTNPFGAPPCFNTTHYTYSITNSSGASNSCMLSVRHQ